MSRYAWPGNRGGEEHADAPGERSRFMARRRTDFDPDGVRIAAGKPRPAPQGAGQPPASARENLWQPLGPLTVLAGQAGGDPRITGRINALAVHPDGERLYAASANGGVWYSRDGGANWMSLGGLAATDTAGINRPAQRNSCGAIAVDFGGTEATDVVYVGTGEAALPQGLAAPDAQPGIAMGGIGILRAEHPASSATPDDPWVREAKNLIGNGVYKIVRAPAGTAVIAATRTGLYQRPMAADKDVDWVRPVGTPFDTLDDDCSDALWTAADGARPARLWVWVRSGPHGGLWVRSDGEIDYTRISTPETLGRRAALAASTPPDQVWVLNDRGNGTLPLLYRVSAAGDTTPVATLVTGVPDILKDQGHYAIAIDVDPANPNRVVLGGSVLATTTPEGLALPQGAAIVVGDVALNGAVLGFGQPGPFTMIGIGAHADVHGLYYSNGGNRLWTCCDGGVFRSDRPLQPAGFYARNNGLQVVESNYIASPPRCEGYVAVGLQDNASIQRRSNGVWTRVPRSSGDGGGILHRPLHPQHLIYQYVRSNWSTSDGTLSDPDMLTRTGAHATTEEKGSAFYSTAAGLSTTRTPALPSPALAVGQVIFGTNRLWYTEETRLLVPPATETALGGQWFTLPSGTDPLPGNLTLDAFGQPITVCRWQDRDVAWVLGEGQLMRYARVPGSDNAGPPGSWSRETIVKKGVKNIDDGSISLGLLRASPVWTDIAVNLDAALAPGGAPRQHGSKGAIYLGTVGKPDDVNVDTLWWFDGTGLWFGTGLRNDPKGVPAPVTAIVCDPDFPAEVYVGTTVGVWKGVRTQVGDALPSWDWQGRLNGLPEAAVEDLVIFSDGGLRLLRAAISARGVWELRLDVTDVPDLCYVRAHDDDMRYRPAVPVQRDGVTARSWHGSPDVRPRSATTALAAPASLPWTVAKFNAAGLRRFQTALRHSTGDPRVRANGQWDAYFSEVLREHAAPILTIPAVPATLSVPAQPERKVPRITREFWNLHMQGSHATAEPWDTPTPTEADLLEFTPALTEGDRSHTSCTLAPRASKVDIVVHYRGLGTTDGANVRVTLLKWIDPRSKNAANWSNSITWFNAVVPWTAAVNELLNTGATSQALNSGWSFVGSTPATRLTTLAGQTLDPLHSGVATFDLNLSSLHINRVVLLVAVIRSGSDITLAPATLENLALASPSMAVRSLRVHW